MFLPREESVDLVFNNDDAFNKLYPLNIQVKAAKHWTRLEVAKTAADFLAPEKDTHVLDIGSGVGKFCIAAAHHKPKAIFYGVEQRKNLVEYSIESCSRVGLYNASFIHANFTQLDLRQFDSFYFYNSFYENISLGQKIDDEVEYSEALYNYYCNYLNKELEKMPAGTRVATFHSLEHEMPASYRVVKTGFHGSLKFWTKV